MTFAERIALTAGAIAAALTLALVAGLAMATLL